jgi:hypothetical protein
MILVLQVCHPCQTDQYGKKKFLCVLNPSHILCIDINQPYFRFHNANNFFSVSRYVLHVLYVQKLDNHPDGVTSALSPYLLITVPFCIIEIPFFASFCLIFLSFLANYDRFGIKKVIMTSKAGRLMSVWVPMPARLFTLVKMMYTCGSCFDRIKSIYLFFVF